MDEIILVAEKYLTDNIKIDVSYLKDLSNSFDYNKTLKLFYIYSLYKDEKIELAYKEFISYNFDILKNQDSFYEMISCLLNADTDKKELVIKLENCLLLDKNEKNKWIRLELFYAYENIDIDYLAWEYIEAAVNIDEYFYEAILQKVYRFDLIENCEMIIFQILQFPQSYVDQNVLNFLGNAYINCNEIENAIKIFEGSINIVPTPEAYYFLGYILHYHKNELAEAMIKYDLSLTLNPLFSEAFFEKAWLYFDLGDYSQAEEKLKKAVEKFSNQDSFYQIILFYLKTGRNNEALNFVKESQLKFNLNFRNEGLELICLVKIGKEPYANKYDMYKKKYSEEELIWFKTTLNNL